MKPLRASLSGTLQWIAFLCIAGYFLVLYIVPPLRQYNIFWLQAFDYGIGYNSSQELAYLRAPFLATRGLHAWADNQDYFQILFAPLHHLPYPHYWILAAHSLAIFACGVFCFLYLRRHRLVSLLTPPVVWMSPYLVNMNLDLFHTEAYATIMLLLVFYAARRGRRALFAAAVLLALACKEDVAVTVAWFMALALLRSAFFRLERRWLVAALAVSVLVFVVNQTVVLPHFKVRTCEWLGADIPTTNLRAGPASPWFGTIWRDLLQPAFYEERFLRLDVLRYLALLLWPAVPFAWAAFPLTLLPLPGAVINILGSGYLIQSSYHYDHSSYTGVIIVMLLGLERVRHRTAAALLLFGGALWINLSWPVMRMRVTAVKGGDFWQIEKDARTDLLERLNALLPPDIVISADYSSINYLLRGRSTVYMLENPFATRYFGIYGLCDGSQSPLRALPPVDLAVVRGDFRTDAKVLELLQTSFEQWRVLLFDGRFPMDLFINPQSSERARLEAAAHAVGATAVAPPGGRGDGSAEPRGGG